MGLFETLKLYATEWRETNSRKFTPEECAKVLSCQVANSNWGKSVMFTFVEGKRYIPLEPTCNVNAGESLDVKNIELVSLVYEGADTTRKGKTILRIRVNPNETSEAISFDNPFGL